MKKQYEDDDGRTIADMSSLDQRSVLSGVVTGLLASKKLLERKEQNYGKSPRENSLEKENRRQYILGAMGAGLLIGVIFLAAFALLVVILLLIWGKL